MTTEGTGSSTDVHNCGLSDRTSFRAFYGGDYLLIVAIVDTGPAWSLHINRRLPDGDVPEFVFERCRKPGMQPLFIIKDAKYAEIVPQVPRPERIRVHHAGGTDDVDVEGLPSELAAYQASLPRDQGLASGSEATGFSSNLSFDEALANANANLPPVSLGPDQIDHIQVVGTGLLFGGIAGFHHLYVKVRRSTETTGVAG